MHLCLRSRRVVVQRASDHEAEIACIARRSATTGSPSRSPLARSLSRAAAFDGRRYRRVQRSRDASPPWPCQATSSLLPTARRPTARETGSATSSSAMPRAASGASTLKAAQAHASQTALAWPAGLVVERGAIVFSEAGSIGWSGSTRRSPEGWQPVHADLPGYPGRLAPAGDGYWLALFAPRSQLVEFVLREPGLPQAHDGRGAAAILGGAEAQVRPQLLRVAAGRRREASRHAQAMGADHVGRAAASSSTGRSSRASACRAVPTAAPMA